MRALCVSSAWLGIALAACGARTSLDEAMIASSGGDDNAASGSHAGGNRAQAGASGVPHGGGTSAGGASEAGASARGGAGNSAGTNAGGASAGMATADAGSGGATASDGGDGNPPLTVQQIETSGTHTCARLSDGVLKCWGYDFYGELGYGNTQNLGANELPSLIPPVQLSTTPGVVATRLALGDEISCTVLSDGSLKCWGNNYQNQLGLGNRLPLSNTTPPSALPAVSLSTDPTLHPVDVSSHGFHTCAALSNGEVRCWGLADLGALGSGNAQDIGDDELPSAVAPLSLTTAPSVGATQLACGYFGACAALSDGTTKCWGSGGLGELGFGQSEVIGDNELPSAAPFASLTNVPGVKPVAITAGDFHVCALLSDASVRCWGFNEYGQLGQGNTDNIGDNELPSSIPPVPVSTKPNVYVIQIAAGRLHNCALLSDGTVKCWGFNGFGQLGYASKDRSIGDDEPIAQLEPIRVTNEPGVFATAISAGGDVTCVRLSDGSAKCWGDNRFGQLGYGNTTTVGDDEAPASVGPISF